MPMRLLGWLLLSLLSGTSWTQGPPPSQGVGERVGGLVISALDGRPVRHALVSLNDTRTGKLTATVTAGENGSFRFDPVPAGKYRLGARAGGFLPGLYRQHGRFSTAIVTGAGLDIGALVLKLNPNAEIAGQVVDETGEPLENAQVILFRQNLPDNPGDAAQDAPEGVPPAEHVRRWRNAQTGADGGYEFRNLAPGEYFVAANATPWYSMHAPAEQPNQPEAYRSDVDPALDVAYPTLFYPHVLLAEEATPIVLRGGEPVTANLQMMPEHAVTLTVRLGGAGERPNAPFPQLTRSVFGLQEGLPLSTSNTGTEITFVGLAPGQYQVGSVTAGSGIPAQRRSQVDLSNGSVAIDAASPVPQANVAVTVHPGPGMRLPDDLSVNLRPAAGDGGGPPQRAIGGKPAIFSGVPEGEYRIALQDNFRIMNVAGVSVNHRAIPAKIFSVTGGGTVAVDVTMAGTPVTVQGFARRDTKPDAGAMVVLVPAGTDTDAILFRRDQSDLDGSFELGNVVPGDYVLIAVEDGWRLPWTDAKALLRYLPQGVPVHVPSEGPAKVDIREAVVAQGR